MLPTPSTLSVEVIAAAPEAPYSHRPPGGAHLRPKLIHVVADGRSLGRHLGYQLRRFVDEGFDVIAVSPSPGPPAWTTDLVHHIVVPALAGEAGTGAHLRSFAELVRLFRRERPAIVHAHDDGSHLASLSAACAARVPVSVVTVRRLDSVRDRPTDAILRAAHHCFLECEEDVRRTPGGRTTWIGTGVDLRGFDPGRADAFGVADLRRSWGISEAGSVVGAEGPSRELRAAMRRVRLAHADAVLVALAGTPGTYAPGALAAGPATGDRLSLELAAVDVFVAGAGAEARRAAVEAAAMGKAVVAADVVGSREIVVDGVTGLIVAPGDARELATAIEELLSAPDWAEALGKAARERALDRFDADGVVERTVQVYRRLLRGHGIRWDGEIPDR